MPCKRFTNEQIAFALWQAENGATVDEVYEPQAHLPPLPGRRAVDPVQAAQA